jgi:flagellar biosynthetic protein FliR
LGVPIINADEFAAFVLVLLRLSMVIAFAPVLGSDNILTEAKVALALTLTFVISPLVSVDASQMPMTWFGFAWLAISELLMGLALAFMVRLVMETANLAGEYLSFQMSMTMVNLMDPQSGGQVPVISRLVYIVFILIFLYANGHLVVIKALVDSFSVAPPGLMVLWRPETFSEVLSAVGRMYVLAVKIAAPVVAILFCAKVSFGIVAKAVPQMQVLFVGMPLFIMVGLAIMGFSLDFWPRLVGEAIFEAQEALKRLIGFFAP